MIQTLTPAASQLLSTLEAVRAEVGAADLSDDAAGALLAQASSALGRYCRRSFGRVTLLETVYPDRDWEVVLSALPIGAVVEVTADGVPLPPERWELDPGAGVLQRLDPDGCMRRWCTRRLVVQYTAGWLLPGQEGRDLPAEVERACLLTIAAWHAACGRDPLMRSESYEGIGSTSWLDPREGSEALPPQAAGLLAEYRLGRS